MNELRQSPEGESSSRFAFFKGPLVARWAAIPLRLIVGYGFMEHGFAKLSKGPRKLRRHPACSQRPRASFHGVAYDFDRTHRRPRSVARGFRAPC